MGGDGHRYGVNGMEREDEVKGAGNNYNTEFRILDVQLGRWWSTDPVFHAGMSPYNTFDNNPIYWIDPRGSNAHGYTIDAAGRIERVDDTGGDNYDVLYRKDDYEKAKASGETNEYGNPEPETSLRVDNTSLLSSLSTTNPNFRQWEYHAGYSYYESFNRTTKRMEIKYKYPLIQGHYGITDNEWEAYRVFKFVVHNSTPEWSLIANKQGIWFIATLHEGSQAPEAKILTGFETDGMPIFQRIEGFEIENLSISIHNHQGKFYEPSGNDATRAKLMRKDNPSLRFRLYRQDHPDLKWKDY